MTLLAESTELAASNVRFSCDSYFKMAELGLLPESHVELIDGRILAMDPQGYRHEYAVGLGVKNLMKALGDDYWVRSQMSLNLAPNSTPEPDIAVVPGSIESFTSKPDNAVLVIEVGETSLSYDRTIKNRIYASNAIADYWIVNLVDNCIEVYRDPIAELYENFTHRYARIESFRVDVNSSPLAFPHLSIPVAHLLPPPQNAFKQ